MRNLTIALLLLRCAVPLAAQHQTLSWPASPSCGPTATCLYSLWRAPTLCPSTALTRLAAGITGLTFTDAATFGSYCYAVSVVINGAESPQSAQTSNTVPPAAPGAPAITNTVAANSVVATYDVATNTVSFDCSTFPGVACPDTVTVASGKIWGGNSWAQCPDSAAGSCWWGFSFASQ